MMSDRKAELEKKKAKLQAFREEKERRRREKEQRDVSCSVYDFFYFKNWPGMMKVMYAQCFVFLDINFSFGILF